MKASEMTNIQIADYILSLQSDVDGFPFSSNEIIREAAKRLLTDWDDDISKDAEIAELEAKLANTETARKFFSRRLDSAKKQVSELRECLKEAVDYNCALCKSKGEACEVEGFCAEHRWRKVLKGGEDGK